VAQSTVCGPGLLPGRGRSGEAGPRNPPVSIRKMTHLAQGPARPPLLPGAPSIHHQHPSSTAQPFLLRWSTLNRPAAPLQFSVSARTDPSARTTLPRSTFVHTRAPLVSVRLLDNYIRPAARPEQDTPSRLRYGLTLPARSASRGVDPVLVALHETASPSSAPVLDSPRRHGRRPMLSYHIQ
jgi:hypothetical protein